MSPEYCTFLDWDTDFFGVRIGKLTAPRLDAAILSDVDAWCTKETIDCLYYQAPANDPGTIQLAEKAGFQLVEVRLIFERHLDDWEPGKRPHLDDGTIIRAARLSDLPAVQDIAQGSYIDSRFYFDRRFTETCWQAYYRTWVRKSLEGGAEMALVAEKDGQLLGYITGVPTPDRTEMMYELTGVNLTVRRGGVGQELFRSGMDWCVQHGIPYIWLATQGRNIATQRMVQRNGFITKACYLYYHRWRDLS